MESNRKDRTEWKKCPKCNGFIPKHWREHKKCGWLGQIGEAVGTVEIETVKDPACAHLPRFCPDCGERLK